MNPNANQSALTGIASILGSALAVWLCSKGVIVTPDQGGTIITAAAGVGAGVFGGVTHVVAGWFHKRAIVAAAVTVPPVIAAQPAVAPAIQVSTTTAEPTK